MIQKFSLTLLFVWILGLLSVPRIQAEVPDEAHNAAAEELNRWREICSEDPEKGRELLQMNSGPRVSMDRARLGEPFVFLVIHDLDIARWKPDEDVDFRRLAHSEIYNFPVMVDGECIAILKIGPEGRADGHLGGGKLPRRLAEISNRHPSTADFDVCLITAPGPAMFMLVESLTDSESLIYPLNTFAAQLLSADEVGDGDFDAISLADAQPVLNESLLEYRDKLVAERERRQDEPD